MGMCSNRIEDLSGFTLPTTVTIVPNSSEPQIAVMAPPQQQLPSVDERIVPNLCTPPKRSTLKKLKERLSDIFFPDNPFHRCLNRAPFQKLLLTLQFFFPVFQWGPNYNLSFLRSDIISGLTIASLAIPQGISYAKLANLPPIIGLYSSFVPPLIYSVLGSSRHVAVGPVSIASLVMGTMLGEAVSFAEEPILYLRLAFTATFFAGVFQASLGLLRLGFVIDFLSRATLIGFTAGAAVIVSLQQLKGLLGMVHFTSKMQIIPVLSSVLEHKEEWQWQTMIMGFGFLLFLLTCKEVIAKRKKLFWVGAAAPLTSVILSTIIVFVVKPSARHVPIIGDLPKGLNPPSLNMLLFSGSHLALTIKTGIITGILSLTEGIAVGRTFATQMNYQVDGNKEMMAIGLMNMAGSCSSCYVTTGSFSRTAINCNSGAQSAFSNVVMASSVLVTLLFLMPLFHYTPNLILAAIIITAVVGLIEYKKAFELWKVDKLDFVACLTSFFGVLFYSVPMGLAISVGVSVFKILLHVTRPNTMALGNLPGTEIYHSLGRYGDAVRIPSFLILAVESPIYFANANYLQERILRWVREEEDHVRKNNQSTIKFVILDMTAVTAIDTSGIEFLRELRSMLEGRSLQLLLINPVGNVMEKLQKSKIQELFGDHGLYLTVAAAVGDISKKRPRP